MSGSTSTPPYAMSPIGLNGLPLLEFIQPLPQATVQLSFPTLAETIAENIAASGVPQHEHIRRQQQPSADHHNDYRRAGESRYCFARVLRYAN